MKIIRFLLFPIAILYHLVTALRNLFFDIKIFKEVSFKIPVIAVGNLSVGGTGKTPQIEYLIRVLQDNYKIAVLSRGYKRKTQGFVLLNKTHSAEDVGDEPLQYFKKFNKISVAVDANRVAGVERLLQEKKPEVVLLDDAYQHRKIKASLYVLLTKYNDLFTDDFLLPTGNLRESSNGAKRSDVILITKCPENLDDLKQQVVIEKLKKYKKPIYFTSISYADKLEGNHSISMDALKDYEVLLVTGIANPSPLLQHLQQKKITYKHLKFPDHHHFSSSDIEHINKKFGELSSSKKILVTTEKDFTRLENKVAAISYIKIETVFLNNKKEAFNALINNHIKQNQRC
ncbi:tetraacyldisaccharide 4'-kinase [Polaribacter sp.]|uniref:tetraacyldisaccharide 4'-kinase n=1 Tax=Polaribacter sp. TaxID=1920175 RepID=UPI003EF8DCDE